MKWAAWSVLLLAGCSTAPVADFLDLVRPSGMRGAAAAPYGGVCGPTVPPSAALAAVPPPAPLAPPGLPAPAPPPDPLLVPSAPAPSGAVPPPPVPVNPSGIVPPPPPGPTASVSPTKPAPTLTLTSAGIPEVELPPRLPDDRKPH